MVKFTLRFSSRRFSNVPNDVICVKLPSVFTFDHYVGMISQVSRGIAHGGGTRALSAADGRSGLKKIFIVKMFYYHYV